MTQEQLRDHLRELGSRGGRRNTLKQMEGRKLGAYRALAKRFPNSVAVQQKLRELEKPSED